MLALYILLGVFAYCFVGGFSASKHDAIASAKCNRTDDHWSASRAWCGHACMSLWLAGILWPIGFPMFIGQRVGGVRQGLSKDEKRRQKELGDAKHQAELARVKRIATEELERELRALDKV